MTTRTVGYLAFLLAAIYLTFRFLMPFVLPFVLGIALAFVLEPALRFLTTRCRLSRGGAAGLLVVVLIGSLALLVSWAVTRIAAEATDLYGYLPQYYDEFNRVIREVMKIAGEFSQQLPEPLARAAQDQWNRMYSLLSAIVSGAGGGSPDGPLVYRDHGFHFHVGFLRHEGPRGHRRVHAQSGPGTLVHPFQERRD